MRRPRIDEVAILVIVDYNEERNSCERRCEERRFNVWVGNSMATEGETLFRLKTNYLLICFAFDLWGGGVKIMRRMECDFMKL
mmetsp:Transcript_9931/g.21494  ORF Transcript_9931/g.21494 Transcript_9931/m.21494 type:complete len:83 (-) Transcript_9931:1-249(-)